MQLAKSKDCHYPRNAEYLCDSQNNRISGRCQSSGVLKTRNTFRKLEQFPSSGERAEDTYSLGLPSPEHATRPNFQNSVSSSV
jgi:hypothetical protein